MKRIYIAGPMSGLPDLNFPAFDAEAARLRAQGFDVVNPAEINGAGTSWEACMRRDIGQLVQCTRIHLLPGWENSKGATLEHHIATTLGLEVSHAHNFVFLSGQVDAIPLVAEGRRFFAVESTPADEKGEV